MRSRLLLLLVLMLAGCATPQPPRPLLEWRGITLAGAEFGEKHLPGVYGDHYVYPSVRSTSYFQAQGMNLMRVAFRWERLQPRLNQDLDATELARLQHFIDGSTARGLHVLLDPHNFARWHGHLIGSAELPIAAFADFWRRLALRFKDNPRVMFGLVNEPHGLPTETWADAAQAAIDAIRATGALNVVTVPGNGWTGAWTWFRSYYGTANAQVMGRVRDPADRMLFEVHQYFDGDGSGQREDCVSAEIGAERLQAFTLWLRQNGRRALLAEIGAGNNPTCAAAMRGAMEHLHANADVWAGWLWWAAGPWWGDYFLSLEPERDGSHKAAMWWLKPYLKP